MGATKQPSRCLPPTPTSPPPRNSAKARGRSHTTARRLPASTQPTTTSSQESLESPLSPQSTASPCNLAPSSFSLPAASEASESSSSSSSSKEHFWSQVHSRSTVYR